MMIREPVVAGRFYPDAESQCRAALEKLLEAAPEGTVGERRPLAGLVPHAGWDYSGAVTARVFKALGQHRPEVVVFFGGVHRYRGKETAMFARGRWETPLGPVQIDSRLAERILGQTNLIVEDPYAHEDEHSLEVQAPFARYLFPDAQIVALMVPASSRAHEVGEAVARTLNAYDYDAVIVGTTDLTHYGPHYGFMPFGIGPKGHDWAKGNDRRFIELVTQMKAGELVAEAGECKNACSAGAAAATVAAAAQLGATEGILLDHCTSSEVKKPSPFDRADSVGYAGIVFV